MDTREWPAVNLAPLPGGGLFRGVQNRLTIPAPAAGADWSKTLPGGQWTALLAIRASLVTSAAVANRTSRLELTDGSATIARLPLGFAITAGLTVGLTWLAGWTNVPAATSGGEVTMPLVPFLLPPGYIVRASTGNIDAADQWSAVELLVCEIDMGPRGEPIGLAHLPFTIPTTQV